MKTNILSLSYNEIFPYSTEKGGDCSGINQQKMRLMAEHGEKLHPDNIDRIIENHHEFLGSGGAGGRWKSLQISDIVIGFYDSEVESEGQQAVFEKMNLINVLFKQLEFPFANFCGVFAIGNNFSFSNLSYSLFTDATLENVNFEGANLKNVDFSRANLRNACFVNANLSGVDFENCDLRGADFTNAKFATARFPGALLDRVKF